MNIAFFTNNYKPFVGGVPVAVENLRQALRRRGHRVYVFAPDYGENGSGPEEEDVIRTWSFKHFNDTAFALPVPTLEPFLQFGELGVNVVHVHHPFLLGETGLLAARQAGAPVVFTYHTQYEKYVHYLPIAEDQAEESAIHLSTGFANCCDAVIAPSSDIRKMLIERGVNVPIRVIPSGADPGRFRQGNPHWLREKCGIAPEAPVMLVVSRLAKEKNIEFLIGAFARLSQLRPDAHLVIAGSGDHETALRGDACAAGVADRIHFTGNLTGMDLVCAFKGASLFVFSSTTETQGMVVLEAMAAGLPVVAVDGPGVRDVVVEGQNGRLVREGGMDAFVQRCAEVLDAPALRETFAANALKTASGLSLSRTAARVIDLYRYVLRHPHPERDERFLLLRELFRFELKRFTEGLEAIIT